MTKGTQVALLAGAVIAAGAVVYVLAFPDTPEPTARAPRAPEPEPPRPAPASAPASAPAPAIEAVFELYEVAGVVEVQRNGAWLAVHGGDKLAKNEVIRTGEGASAKLRDPAGAELVLREKVQLEVRELSETVTALALTRGKVRAAPAANGAGRMEIEAGGARAVAPAGTRFTVYADPRGAVAVASEEGQVQVIAQGREVAVPKQQQTVVEPGKAPANPVAIPADVFLSVAWPERVVAAPRATVQGTVTPGSIVRVNGQPAQVGPDGKFTTVVPLADGKNKVEVSAEDMAGREKVVQGQVTAKPNGPAVQADPSRMFDPPPQQQKPKEQP
jgi:hypothetical protein